MNRADVKVDIYLDTPEQKRDLRSKAGERDMSMTAFAKAIVLKALGDPIFLSDLSDNSDNRQDNTSTPSEDYSPWERAPEEDIERGEDSMDGYRHRESGTVYLCFRGYRPLFPAVGTSLPIANASPAALQPYVPAPIINADADDHIYGLGSLVASEDDITEELPALDPAPITPADIAFTSGRLCVYAQCVQPAAKGMFCEQHQPAKQSA